ASHLAGELFNQRAGVEMVHVPYKGGAPALQDLLGERVTSYFAAPPTALPHVETGKLIPLATTGLVRPAYMPNIPTVAEAGYPGFEALNWYAFVGPAKTPAVILDRWNREIVKVLNDEEVKKALQLHGLTPQPTTRKELAAFIQKEYEQWGKVVRERKLSMN
ncbi:MAG: tripartite tricarboxylate transporter substrate-binding protein, partial [Comamonas sp.]